MIHSWLRQLNNLLSPSARQHGKPGKKRTARNLFLERLQERILPSATPLLVAPTTQTVLEGTSSINLGTLNNANHDTIQVSVDWQDGTAPASFTTKSTDALTEQHNFEGAQSYQVEVTATDTTPNTDVSPSDFTFTVNTTEVSPTPTLTGFPANNTSPEGTTISLTGSAADPSTTDTAAGFSYTWSVTKIATDGTMTANFASGNQPTATNTVPIGFTPNDNGTYIVTLNATDTDGATGTLTAGIDVTNVAPVATIKAADGMSNPPTTGIEGTQITLAGLATDPSSVDQNAGFDFEWSVTGPDGSMVASQGNTTLSPDSFGFTPNLVGTYRVTLNATDKDGGTSQPATLSINVAAAALSATKAPDVNAVEGATTGYVTVATFTDANPGATAADYSATINWGDQQNPDLATYNNGGIVDLRSVNGTFAVQGIHSYAEAGSYPISVTINDVDGASATLSGASATKATVAFGPASQVAFTTLPSNTPETAAINPAVQVAVEDTSGNVLTGDQTDSVTIALASAPAGAAFTGGSTTTAMVVNGIATFNNLHLTTAGAYTLSESATGGLTGPASSTFNVTLVVVPGGFVATPTGFTATFSQAFNPATINLTGPTGTEGPVAVTLNEAGVGLISGSLYLDPTDTKLTFVQTVVIGSNGLPVSTGSLPLGTYTVTLVSGSSALTTTNGVALDGNSDGTAGDNYTATFHVVSSNPAPGDVLLPSTAVLATAPDFARGPLTPSVTIASSNGATEAGNTVTITTTLAHGFSAGQTVTIAGVGLSGYDGMFTITSVPSRPSISSSPTTFTYTVPTAGLAASGGGMANVAAVNVANNSGNGIPIDLTVLAPVQTVTFGSAISTGTTGTFKLGFNSQTTVNITVGTAIKAQTLSASTSGASALGTTVTIRTATVTGLKVGESVTINGVSNNGYNGTFTVTSVPTTTSFMYTTASGLGLSGGGTWNVSSGTALATAIQNALGALSVVGGTANVGVAQVGSTNAYTVTFATAVANPNLMTVAANTISGAPTLTIVNPNAPAGVTDATLVLSYNANLLNITAGTVNASLPGSPTFTVYTSGSGAAALATITFHSSVGVNLGSLGSVDLGGLLATVPRTAPYKSEMLLHFVSESLNSGTLTAAGVDGYQVVAYQGDTDGNGSYSGNDQTLLNAVAGGSSPGFAAYREVDPLIIGGLNGGTSISATDSGLLSSYLNGVAIPQVPDQTGVTPTLFTPGPDPTISIPTGLVVGADGTVVVPVNLDDARPAGSTGLAQAELALTYDPSAFTVSAADVQLGTIPSSGSGWTLRTVVDAVTGQLAITLLSQTPIATSLGGSLVTITLHRAGTALSGTTPIALAASVDPNGQGMFPTALFDTDNRFILSPAPTNAAPDADASVRLEASPATAAVLVRPDGDALATSDPVAPTLDAQRLATAPQAAEVQSLPTAVGAGASEAEADPARPSVLRSVRSDDLAADVLPMVPATVVMVAAPAVSLTFVFGAPVLVNSLADRLWLAGTPARLDPTSPWPGAGAIEDNLDTLLAGVWVRSRSAQDTFESQVWDGGILDDLVALPAPASQVDGTSAMAREWVNETAQEPTLSDDDGDVFP